MEDRPERIDGREDSTPTTVAVTGSPPASSRTIAGNMIAGEVETTPGAASAAPHTASGSRTTPDMCVTTTWGLNERIFSRQTSPKPVITASTIIRIATPSATPVTVMTGMTEANDLRGRRHTSAK